MKSFYFVFGALVMCMIFFASCDKDVITSPVSLENVEQEQMSTFIPANEDDSQMTVDEMLKLVDSSKETDLVEKGSGCCEITLLEDMSDYGYLKVKYHEDATVQRLKVLFFLKEGSSWGYVGHIASNNYHSTCSKSGFTMPIYFLPSGDYYSVAILEDGSTRGCDRDYLLWTKD